MQRTQQYADNSFFISIETGKLKTAVNICNSNHRNKPKNILVILLRKIIRS